MQPTSIREANCQTRSADEDREPLPDDDRVPQRIEWDQQTARYELDPEPPLQPAPASPPVPQLLAVQSGATRRYFTPAPKRRVATAQDPVAIASAFEDDPFSLPTRVTTPMPRAQWIDHEPQRVNRSRRPYWLWNAATMLALVASVGVVRATGDDRDPAESVVTPPKVIEQREAENHESASPIVGSGPCRLAVHTVPAGSTVELDGAPQGLSPLTIATACGQHRIDISHPTYARKTVWGMLVDGRSETLELTLSHRIDAVTVVSRPAGAMLYIDGHPVGRTPRQLDVLGHVPLTLEIRKVGYRTVFEHLYTTTPRSSVTVGLTPSAVQDRRRIPARRR